MMRLSAFYKGDSGEYVGRGYIFGRENQIFK
jgi:hypothetical protein